MSKRMSQPAAPASTIVTTVFLLYWVGGQGFKGWAVPSHPLGDFEDEPAETGEAQAPKKHHSDHRLDPMFFTE
jgi:hypothetical protein